MSPLVVIIDDDLDLLHMAKRYLERASMRWRTFPLGLPALDWLAETKDPLGVIVVDLGLPDVAGFEVCERLRAHDNTRDVPLIIMSARQGLDDEARAEEVGAQLYLRKPFHGRQFVETIAPLVRAATEKA